MNTPPSNKPPLRAPLPAARVGRSLLFVPLSRCPSPWRPPPAIAKPSPPAARAAERAAFLLPSPSRSLAPFPLRALSRSLSLALTSSGIETVVSACLSPAPALYRVRATFRLSAGREAGPPFFPLPALLHPSPLVLCSTSLLSRDCALISHRPVAPLCYLLLHAGRVAAARRVCNLFCFEKGLHTFWILKGPAGAESHTRRSPIHTHARTPRPPKRCAKKGKRRESRRSGRGRTKTGRVVSVVAPPPLLAAAAKRGRGGAAGGCGPSLLSLTRSARPPLIT